MPSFSSHYDILGVKQDADITEIKKAYRKQARLVHPDMHGGNESPLYLLIEEAYRVLSNADSRAAYDDEMQRDKERPEAGPGEQASTAEEAWGQEESWGEEESWDAPAAASPTPAPAPDRETADPGDIPPIAATVSNTSWWSKVQERQADDETFYPLPVSKLRAILPVVGSLAAIAAAIAILWIGLGWGIPSILAVVPPLIIWPYLHGRGKTWRLILFILMAIGGGVWAGAEILNLITSYGSASVSEGDSPSRLLLLLAYLLVFVTPFVAARPLRQYRRAKLLRKEGFTEEEATYRILGRPGEGLVDALDKFGQRNIALGQMGERMTGDVMRQLSSVPGVRIIHGLDFPESQNADVDHAVIVGNKIALVDSKLWKPGHYSFTPDGEIVRGNQGYRGLELTTHFPVAVERYQRIFPDLEIVGYVLIHPSAQGEVSTDNTYASNVALVDAQTFLEYAGHFLFGEKLNNVGNVDRTTLSRIWHFKQAK